MLDFFQAKVRPILVKHCYACHSSEAVGKKKLKGGLLVDSRDGTLTGGKGGPAMMPGQPDKSLLINALKYDSFKMPPPSPLPDEIVADFSNAIYS